MRGERSGLRREERWTKEERKEGGATESEARERERVERTEGQKRKETEGWVKGRQPGIVGRWRHVGGSTGPAPLGKCGNLHRAPA